MNVTPRKAYLLAVLGVSSRTGSRLGGADPGGDHEPGRRPERQAVRRGRPLREDLGEGLFRRRSDESAQSGDRRYRPGAAEPRRKGRVLGRLFILKPKDLSRGNGVVFFDVINRGRFRLLSTFSAARGLGRSDDGSRLRRCVVAPAGLHARRGRLAVRRRRRADRVPGAGRDEQRAADKRVGARVVHSDQAE